MIITPELTTLVAKQFSLDLQSPHGPAHWMRVRANGLNIARHTGACKAVVELFSLFHDSRRVNDFRDPGHGARGAELAFLYYKQGAVSCSEDELELLMIACSEHTDGKSSDSETIATCWDADRLDLPRVGVEVNPDLLCTPYAREAFVIEQAKERALLWLNNTPYVN